MIHEAILSFITWNVKPEIIQGLHVRWYGLLFVMGFPISYYIMQKYFKHEKLDKDTLDGLFTAGLLGVILGARLGHCLFYQPDYYLKHPLEILMVWEGGLASHGATIGLLLAFYIFARKRKIDYFWVLSRTAIFVPLFAGLIRMGNLMNSEIYGHTTSLPWGFLFVNSTDVLYGYEKLEPKHPTQLYEALFYFLIFIILQVYYFKNQSKNKVNSNFIIGFLLTSIFTFRFFVEFLKNNQVEFEQGMPINMGQILSIPFILIGLFFLWRSYFNKAQSAGVIGNSK